MASGIFGQAGSIMFTLEFPQSLNFSKSANWKSLSAATGQAHPAHLYSLSDSATISLTVRLSHADGTGGMMAKLKTMRAMVYPIFNRANPKVIVEIESYLRMEGFVNNYSESIPDDGGWVGREPNVVDVTISITEDTNDPGTPKIP